MVGRPGSFTRFPHRLAHCEFILVRLKYHRTLLEHVKNKKEKLLPTLPTHGWGPSPRNAESCDCDFHKNVSYSFLFFSFPRFAFESFLTFMSYKFIQFVASKCKKAAALDTLINLKGKKRNTRKMQKHILSGAWVSLLTQKKKKNCEQAKARKSGKQPPDKVRI